MSVTLSLTLCEGVAYEKRRVVLYRQVEWPSIPPEGACLTFGRREDGELAGINATVGSVFWEACGDVDVEAEADRLRDEYEAIVALARADGFLEYEDWKATQEGPA